MRSKYLLPLLLCAWTLATAQTFHTGQNDALIEKYKPLPAPQPSRLVLKRNDRLAICGDSITEQKMYSRLIEDYLTVCVPELNISVRQYGWGGEKAAGFLARMTNDCLRFHPTIATTCYGMNDHEYRAYEDRIGKTYRDKSTAIVEAFEANGVRVIEGSPGCVGKIPRWGNTNSSLEDLNLNLDHLRNIDIEIAEKEHTGFADVFWPMLTAGATAQQRYGSNYAIAGADGVHPGWAGHTVMAYAFLKAFGLSGEIGTFTVDLKKGKMKVSSGHEVHSAKDSEFQIKSMRYPFCACVPAEAAPAAKPSYPACEKDDPSKDSSIRSAMTLVPFNQQLNRLMLVVKNANAATYKVTWGAESQNFSAEQLARGVNLAEEFSANPFCEAFAKVDAAVSAKQNYETKQIKQNFRSAEAKADMEAAEARTEAERAPLVEAIKAAFVPVTHTIRIEAQ